MACLQDRVAFDALLAPLRKVEWVVFAKRPFAGPEAVLAYLSRYTHRVAISNRRLAALDDKGVTFKWKDYRAKGRTRYKRMTLAADEFIRRFLLRVLPAGFHRIRHGACPGPEPGGSLPTAAGQRISPVHANCSASHRRKTRSRSSPRLTSRRLWLSPVPAAATP